MSAAPPTDQAPRRTRPTWPTVFAAAFVAGAFVAVGVNRFLDVHLAQRRPQVECEPIFVALHALPQGSPVTVWDVALRDWPKAMLPPSALRAHDSFEGSTLRHAVREGQPLLAAHLVRAGNAPAAGATVGGEAFTVPEPIAKQPVATATETDLWTPAPPRGDRPAEPPPPTGDVRVAEGPPAAPADTVVTTTPPSSTDVDPSAPAPPTVAEQPDPRPAVAQPAVVAEETPQPTAEPETVAAVPAAAIPPAVIAGEEDVPPAPAPAAAPPARLDAGLVGPPPVAPSPADIDSPGLAATQPSAGEPTPVPDIASMPSVMVPDSSGVAAAAAAPPASGGRYLVVPERIALQADTSFAAPARPAPAAAPAQAAKTSAARPASARPANPRPTGSGDRRDAAARGQSQQPAASPTASGQRTWTSFFPNFATTPKANVREPSRSGGPAGKKPAARR